MQAIKNKGIMSKLLMAVLSVALVFTMMPLAGGAAFAEQTEWNPEDIALVVDSNQLKISDIEALESVEITSADEQHKIKGVTLGTIIDTYNVKKQKITIDTIDYDYDPQFRIVELKETARNYVLAYMEDNQPIFKQSKKAKEQGVELYGCLNLYDPNSIVNDSGKLSPIQKLTGKITAGAPAVDPSTLIKTITIKGNALKTEKVFENLDAMRNDASVQSKVKEDVVFNWANSEGTTGTAKVTGITIADLIEIVGLKDNMKVKEISVSAADGQWDWKYSADTLLKPDLQGNLAMFAWTYWASDKNKTETDQQRTIVGQFSAGEVNQPSWGKMICEIVVTGEEIATEPSTEPSTEPAQKPAVENGQKATVGGSNYTVTSAAAGTAAFTKAKNAKSVTVPATVKVNGKTLKVTQINAKAFTGKKIKTVTVGKNVKKIAKNAFNKSKATTVIVKTKALKKASVKGSLKGSKVKTVKVKVGSKKVNKTYVKKYKKIFTKKNAGKKVKVK